VGGNIGAAAPFFELGGAEQPVAGAGEGGLDVVPARVEVGEAQGAEAVWWLSVVLFLERNSWIGGEAQL
jgi:hypothetical protein